MRIVMLGWEFAPYVSGGLGRACEKITDALLSEGHEVDFVVPHCMEPTPRPGFQLFGADEEELPGPAPATLPLSSFAISDDEAEIPPLIRSPYLVAPRSPSATDPYAGNLTAAVERYTSRVAALFHQHPCDVIHAHDWLTFPAGKLLARKLGVPLVAHFHSLEIDRNPYGPHPVIAGIERMAVQVADRVVAVSEFTRRRLETHYGMDRARSCVVHNGGDSFQPGPACPAVKAGATVLFMGRLTGQKGVQHLCPISREVLRSLPHARFVVAGKGDMEGELRARIAEEGLGGSFEIVGALTGDEVTAAYQRADVVVMPSEAEPFGLVATEAVELGVPVVLSLAAGVSEVLPHAFRADPADPVAFAHLITLLLENQEIREAVTRQLQEDLAVHTWARTARLLTRAYQQVVELEAESVARVT